MMAVEAKAGTEKKVLVALKGVRKEFNGFVAVDRMDLEVYEGEFLCFLGPSGCGKTTTLRMIAGLETPTEGEIYLAGERITYLPPQQRNIGFVFQNYALFWHMTVYDNLAFGLRLRKKPRKEIDRKVREVARRFELEDVLKKKAAQLDLSSMQRVAIARTILIEPHLLLLDEPLNNIRPGLREIMRADLKRMQRELGRTMIYVTHDQEEAMTLGDRVLVMNQARVEQLGPPMEIYQRPASLFVAGFIGRPPMNLIPVEYRVVDGQAWVVWRRHRWSVEGIRSQVEESSPEGGLVLGIRPEHMRLNPDGRGIPARVEVVQPLGRKDVVTLKVEEISLQAVVSGEVGLRGGMQVGIELPSSEIHLFHSGTGKAVAHGIG